jgi:hypothetical protein
MILHKRKYLVTIPILATLVLLGYWLKCQMDVEFIESVSLSGVFPFNYLQRDNVVVPVGNEVLVDESFDSRKIFPDWSGLWMREKGKVIQSYDSDGMNHSRCLLIRSESTKSWAYPHRNIIEVKAGDVFGFNGFARVEGEACRGFAGVETLDEKKKVIKWNYARVEIGEGRKTDVTCQMSDVSETTKGGRGRKTDVTCQISDVRDSGERGTWSEGETAGTLEDLKAQLLTFSTSHLRRQRWVPFEGKVVVPEGVRYIRFRLSGVGVGEVRVDGVKLKAESSEEAQS